MYVQASVYASAYARMRICTRACVRVCACASELGQSICHELTQTPTHPPGRDKPTTTDGDDDVWLKLQDFLRTGSYRLVDLWSARARVGGQFVCVCVLCCVDPPRPGWSLGAAVSNLSVREVDFSIRSF